MPDRGQTLVDLFLSRVEASGARVALRYERRGAWCAETWREWEGASADVALGLSALGVEAGDRVGLVAATRVEWVHADLGILRAGAVTVPAYPTLRAAAVAEVLADAGARVVIVEDPVELEKLLDPVAAAALPDLEAVIVVERAARLDTPDAQGRLVVTLEDVRGPTPRERPRVLSWTELAELGRRHVLSHPSALERRRAALTPESLATIVYTSGTTGVPRGVMLTHGAFVFEAGAVAAAYEVGEDDIHLLMLPLAHIFGRLTVALAFSTGHVTAFARSPLTVLDDCAVVRPTFMASVPRLFEKVHETAVRALADSGEMKARVFQWALDVGGRAAGLERRGKVPIGLLAVERRYADKMIFSKIRARFGGRMRFLISGAAPLPVEVAEFFHAAKLVVLEGYGLTETTAAATVSLPGAFRFGSVGKPLAGVEVRVADDGEILVRGPSVTKGYWGRPSDTSEAIDGAGWLRTGDLGRVDGDGFVYVTGRKKDLIVTAGGRNVAPQRLEGLLCESPLVQRAIVLGDGRSHLVALLVLDDARVRELARERGLSVEAAAELRAHPAVEAVIQAHVDTVNARVAPHEAVRRFAVLERDLSLAAGELTPTDKVRRVVVAERHAALVDGLYAE